MALRYVPTLLPDAAAEVLDLAVPVPELFPLSQQALDCHLLAGAEAFERHGRMVCAAASAAVGAVCHSSICNTFEVRIANTPIVLNYSQKSAALVVDTVAVVAEAITRM